MARYHFHIQDGVMSRDESGQELRSLDAARLVAVDILTQTLRCDAEQFWRHNELSIVVTDERDLILFTVDLTTTPAPAIGGRPRTFS